ncbi:MAG: hypothetical protein AAF862_11800, partial [Pseudomonadota bacterium]
LSLDRTSLRLLKSRARLWALPGYRWLMAYWQMFLVKKYGNWVGGRVVVDDETLVFSMNRLNKFFQEDQSELVMSLAELNHVQMGRMFFLFKTVDCLFGDRKVRFRCFGRTNDRLLDVLKSHLGRRN